ncbi:MAG: DUF1549 domain-containing protein, partial [Planctomycetaceae bacterium]|nr:DUF1549 domain-containing protein [Planctomycetaceae bacterium]
MSNSATADNELFRTQVARVFTQKCISCHRPDQAKGGLDLTTRAALLRGGDSGVALVPGIAEESSVYLRVLAPGPGESPEMPEQGDPLTEAEALSLKQWIQEGANWPEDLVLHEQSQGDRSFWSFQAVASVNPPTISTEDTRWVRNPIDQFILQRLRQESLSPGAAADPRTFIRRATFDLWGLPPAPEDVANFESDCRMSAGTTGEPLPDDAVQRLIDRLLDSPHYGERWARHWLDVIRFGESQGFERNRIRENAWRYRDWVINAINSDMPYDQFTREQLAGDLLPEATTEQILATAFHRNTMTNDEGGTDNEEFRVLAVKDRVDTTVQVWMGLTMGCAKCHTHKYDPITHTDYYSL